MSLIRGRSVTLLLMSARWRGCHHRASVPAAYALCLSMPPGPNRRLQVLSVALQWQICVLLYTMTEQKSATKSTGAGCDRAATSVVAPLLLGCPRLRLALLHITLLALLPAGGFRQWSGD